MSDGMTECARKEQGYKNEINVKKRLLLQKLIASKLNDYVWDLAGELSKDVMTIYGEE